MGKILLAAVNACYNHTNIAVRSLSLYSGNPENVCFREWTINQPVGDILRGIFQEQPTIVLFSVYIWNAEIVQKIICDLKKILPHILIGAGGPEISYCADFYLNKLDSLDFVISGEGERTCREIAELQARQESVLLKWDAKEFLCGLKSVKGIYLKDGLKDGVKIIFTGNRELICDLSELPFPYPEITDPDNRIYYYESTRGCPFSCAYCMSSLDKKVRFMPLKRVFADLQRFLDANVRLVKFVDRTYNLNEERYIAIWQYILSHHNGKTMFHFEIEAEFLSEKALEFLKSVPAGVMQFEIGVQSSNPQTLNAVGRSENTEILSQNIRRIPRTIHSHLDLIAGLPFETLEIFGKSFDFVMDLKPDALQLGFLKVLHGTKMMEYSEKNGWLWMENPPYETFCTPYMSYADMMFLKNIEVLVDAYWNSHSFDSVMNYVFRVTGCWNFFCKLTEIARKNGVFEAPRREQFWFEFLAGVADDIEKAEVAVQAVVLQELLRFDFIKAGKKGGFPSWCVHNYNKEAHRAALENHGGVRNSRLDFAYSDYDEFLLNPLAEKPEETLLAKSSRKCTESEGEANCSGVRHLQNDCGNGEKLFAVLFVYQRKEKDAPSVSGVNANRQYLC